MYATATKMAMKEGFELSEETLAELSYDKLGAYKNHAALDKRYNGKNRSKGISLATRKQQKSNPDNPRPDRAKVGATDHPGHADTKHNYAKTNQYGKPTGSSEINYPSSNEIDKDQAAKKAQKERGMKEETLAEISRDTLSSYKKKAQDSAAKNMIGSKGDVKTMDKRIRGIKRADKKLDQKNREASMKKEATVLPSDGGNDGGGTPPKYTTKNGTNYKNGKPVGPVMDTDGASATKKEEKEIKEKVTASGTVTPSKLAARDAKNDPKSTQMGVAGAQGQGKVGMSSTSTPQPFSGTVGKKAPAGTVSPVQRLRNLLGK
jgi:hypothetical protein